MNINEILLFWLKLRKKNTFSEQCKMLNEMGN